MIQFDFGFLCACCFPYFRHISFALLCCYLSFSSFLSFSLVNGDFVAAAVLISWGGVLGKVSPSQMMVATVFEVCFYALNEKVTQNRNSRTRSRPWRRRNGEFSWIPPSCLSSLCPITFRFFFLLLSLFQIVAESLMALDMGGSMVIHTFGAYFGLGLTVFLTPKARGQGEEKSSKDKRVRGPIQSRTQAHEMIAWEEDCRVS